MNSQSETNSFNIWNYKPWWCQPWSIILTGITIVSGCWFLTRIWWLTIALSVLISLWWGYFLILYPRAIKQLYANSSVDDHS